MTAIDRLQKDIKACQICAEHLPLGPRPVATFSEHSRILIIGQAPGTKVHQSGIPWDDASGRRLRDWMGLAPAAFYDTDNIAIVPMGFCYPGRGKSGDLPPRKECAPQWHTKILETLPKIQMMLLIGQYAQHYYLPKQRKRTLTETVRNFEAYLPRYFPLVHPSPRNQIWMKKNPWFVQEVVPALKTAVAQVLRD